MRQVDFANDQERIDQMRVNLKVNARAIAKWAQENNADMAALKAEFIRRCPIAPGFEREAIIRLIEAGNFDQEFAGILGCY